MIRLGVDHRDEPSRIGAIRPNRTNPPMIQRDPRTRPRARFRVPRVVFPFSQRLFRLFARYKPTIHPTRCVFRRLERLRPQPPSYPFILSLVLGVLAHHHRDESGDSGAEKRDEGEPAPRTTSITVSARAFVFV